MIKVTEYEKSPVEYREIIVYPEYYLDKGRGAFIKLAAEIPDGQYAVCGVGRYEGYTTVMVGNCMGITGERKKISIFSGEPSQVSPILNAIDISTGTRLGVIVCREVLHTCIAEVYRLMKVNLLACCIAGGEFWGLQRESWIDQISLFSTIVGAPLVAASGATKDEGGLNLIVEP